MPHRSSNGPLRPFNPEKFLACLAPGYEYLYTLNLPSLAPLHTIALLNSALVLSSAYAPPFFRPLLCSLPILGFNKANKKQIIWLNDFKLNISIDPEGPIGQLF